MNYETDHLKNTHSTLPVCAFGSISYDFETEEHREAFVNLMKTTNNHTPNPYNPQELLDYLAINPSHASSLIWTLNLNNTPICALMPMGIFTWNCYVIFKNFLYDKLNNINNTVSISGILSGNVSLLDGTKIPVIIPDLTSLVEERLIS